MIYDIKAIIDVMVMYHSTPGFWSIYEVLDLQVEQVLVEQRTEV